MHGLVRKRNGTAERKHGADILAAGAAAPSAYAGRYNGPAGLCHEKKSEISLSYQENTNEKLKAIGENVDVWIRDKKREVYEAFQKPATESGIRDFYRQS